MLSQPPDLALIVNGLAAAGWLLWLWLLTHAAMRHTTRHRRWLKRWRLPTPLHALSTSLAGSVALVTATGGAPPDSHRSATPSPMQPANTAVPVATTPTAFTASPPRPADRHLPVYRVARGDWMTAVAQRYLGDQARYVDIARLNPQWKRHDDRFPDHWEPGWTMVLPADAHDRGPRRHATGHLVGAANPTPPAQPPPDANAEPAPGPTPSGSPSGSPAVTPSTNRHASPSTTASTPAAPDPDGVVPEPAGQPSSSSTRSPSTGATGSRTAPAPAPDADHDQGVDLPGGWITLPMAAALIAAAAMVWRRRQHRYVPRPVHGETSADPDLRPLPPVVTRLRHAVGQQAPDLLDPPAPRQPTVAEYANADADELELPPVGPTGVDLAGLTAQVPAGGLGLTGPGTEPAARALLVAALSTGGPTDPDARGQVVIPADALSILLGAHAGEAGAIARLNVTPTLSDALVRVEELLIERRRQLQEHDAADLDELRAAVPYYPPMPPVLLLANVPDLQLRARLSATLHLGAPLQISAVLFGDWPHGGTVTVHADGRTTAADGQRLAVLDVPTTVQLLHVLREAHSGQPAQPAHTEPSPDAGIPDTPTPEQPSSPDDGAATNPTAGRAAPAPASERASDPAAVAEHTSPGRVDQVVPLRPRRPVRIQLLGEPAIFDRDGTVVTGLRRHARQLLVYLAVHRDGADLDDIMEAFWPTATVRRAGERLSTEVGNLRGRIRQAAADNKIEPVTNTGGRYVLNREIVDIDLWRMSDALRRAGTATDLAERTAALHEAVDVHTGGLADGHDYDWIEQPRELVRRHGVRARLHLANLVAEHDPAEAATLAEAAADRDPYNEETARHAMRGQARIGDAAGIRARLQRLRDALDEIDEEPSGETVALAGQLQRQISDTAGPRTRRPQPDPSEHPGDEPPSSNR